MDSKSIRTNRILLTLRLTSTVAIRAVLKTSCLTGDFSRSFSRKHDLLDRFRGKSILEARIRGTAAWGCRKRAKNLAKSLDKALDVEYRARVLIVFDS